ncbi:1-acyl-sn-glycerol-3-phosphate acyltransferase [Synechococcus sp. CBW1107]|uniref:1-acyl-sn-glycerol-3-phosphate acyltransferase n=1 Tax=Synechococcus sp. CBW1107 TaxID=2789857 RepID=UPI0018CD1895|nr:1-acyl-sn-glycerol-3-phosphate acyltransferase [Synechococcus sp. CBW1107]QPN55977.1 1-acyl-sn-glycerol-3-phosphate acyltransferase [Synechococcus sp. CBW1107]
MPRAGIQAAQPALRFIPPDYSRWMYSLCRAALPWLLRARGLVHFETSGSESLAALFAEAQSGRCRLLIAFRHPSTTDPLVMAQLLWREVPRAARRHGLSLKAPVHSQFLYDRGIPLWAGAAAGWILSKLGGIPIQRGKLDRLALRTARELFAHGPFPLAIAPEGVTNNHGELVSPLEPGLAQMAFWCCEDLAAAGRHERVLIVPIGLQYLSTSDDWRAIDRLLGRLEDLIGLSTTSSRRPADPDQVLEPRYQRLIALSERLLSLLEGFYHLSEHVPAVDLLERLDRLREQALSVAEAHFQLSPRGSVIERCRRIEQAAWACIYRDDLEELSEVERSLADWAAREADLRMAHMRLVEHFATLSGSYVAEKPSIDRYGEVLMIFWRAVAWIRGREEERPPALGPWRVRMVVAEPIDVLECSGAYRRDRRGAVERLTAELRERLEAAIG